MLLKPHALHRCHGTASLTIALAASLLAVGCARNQPPTVSAGPDLSVDAGERVTLTGEASDPDGAVQGYRWEQVSGEPVPIGNAQRATAQFLAPAVDAPTTLTFRLTAIDDGGAAATGEAIVAVRAVRRLERLGIRHSARPCHPCADKRRLGDGQPVRRRRVPPRRPNRHRCGRRVCRPGPCRSGSPDRPRRGERLRRSVRRHHLARRDGEPDGAPGHGPRPDVAGVCRGRGRGGEHRRSIRGLPPWQCHGDGRRRSLHRPGGCVGDLTGSFRGSDGDAGRFPRVGRRVADHRADRVLRRRGCRAGGERRRTVATGR